MMSLLIWPGSHLALEPIPAFASAAINVTADSARYVALLWRWLFGSQTPRPVREKLADRLAHVSRVNISPRKFVGYQGQHVSLSAVGTDYAGRTIQGVRLSWASSDEGKVQIDDSGQATLISPGLAWITCTAGFATTRVPVLVRLGARRMQTDEEWRLDQDLLREDGTVARNSIGPGGDATIARFENLSGTEGRFTPAATEGTASRLTRLLTSLADKLSPTVHAQTSGGDFQDFLYDELWSQARNLVGSPRNRVTDSSRIGAVLPEGSNFEFSVPIEGLGGRGLPLGLSLNYNSRIWSRHASAVTFNAVNTWPYLGFTLGFGRIVTYGSDPNTKFVLIDSDGTRHYLGSGVSWQTTTYQTNDGTHITYVGNATGGGTIYFTSGVTMSVNVVNNRLLVTQIKEPNGNYVTISYATLPFPSCNNGTGYQWKQAINTITDTLGRVIQFNYDDCNNLVSITAPGFGGTSQNPVTTTVAQFDYSVVWSVSTSFSGLTVENVPSGHPVVELKHVYFPPTQTGYKFDYSAYGMIYNVSMRRQMTYDSGTGAISDGTESAAVSFNYPTVGSSLTDAPAFTQRTESANSSPTATYTYSTTTDSVAKTKTFTITRPDSSQVLLTRSTDGSLVANGLLVQSEIKSSSGASMAKAVLAYANDPGGSPQVQAVTGYDDTGTATQANFDYDQYGNVTNRREFGFQISGAWQVRRRTRNVYKTDAAYLNAYLRSLVIEFDVYDAQQNTSDADDVLIAKSTYTYDDYAAAMGGMENYGGTAFPPGHDSTYDTTKTVRGNITGTTQWIDIAGNISTTRLSKYDIFGNAVKAQVSCCNEKSATLVEGNGWSQPEQVTTGDPSGLHLTTSSTDDYNTGLIQSETDPRNKTTSCTYDAALRTDIVTAPAGATADANYNDSAQTSSETVNYTEGVVNKTLTTNYTYDGWGRTISVVGANGGQMNTTYDSMGRVVSRTNPFQSGQAPGPSTSYSYDALDRATVVTLPDSQTVQTAYSGASVTVTDQVNRKIKRESDGLGRLVKVYEQDATGALTQNTDYTYDLMGRLTGVNQGNQLRTFKYDLLGRLLYERIPEQSATINDGTGAMWSCKYTYTDSNHLATKTDARGVITSYTYDSMNRLTQMSYNTSGAPGVASTPTVTYNYDNVDQSPTKGLLLSISVGTQSSESYGYDTFNRVSSVTRTIGSRNYATSYQYTTAGQVTQLSYPSNRQLNVSHDSIGRLSSIVNNGDSTNYLSGVSYNWAGQTTGWTLGGSFGGGIVESMGYSSTRMELTSQTATQNGSTRLSLTYGYQASAGQMGAGSTAGNAGQLMSVSGTIGGTTESASYTYDLLGRLVTSDQTSNGASAQRRFVYDRWGNRPEAWNATSGGTQIQSVTLEQSGGAPTNRIPSVTNSGVTSNYTYDAAGNVTNDGLHSYTYDAENRIVSVDGGATGSYSYDHQNRRIKKVVGSSTTHYVWQASQVIAEHNGSTGVVTTEYIFAGGRTIAREQSGRMFFLYDRLSIRATITDGQGGIQGRQAHLPFGEDFGESGPQDKHHFTSYERDGESGLDNAINRGYSSAVGRFLQADPSKGRGRRNPQSWNRYSYTRNNPVNRTDRLGLDDNPVNVSPCWWENGILKCPDVGGYVSINGRLNPGRAGVSGGGTTGDEIGLENLSGDESEPIAGGDPQLRETLPQKQVKSFRDFLNGKDNDMCRQKLGAAYPDIVNNMNSAVAEVGFIDTNAIKDDLAGVYFPSFLIAYGIANRNVTVGDVFKADFLPGQIIRAVTESPVSGLGTPGIYAPGGSNSPFFQGSAGLQNLQHELVHYITGKSDKQLADKLGITGDVAEWFKRGCKNEGE